MPSSNLTTIELAQKLIRFDTCNPPGKEKDCALFLAGLFQEAGFSVSLPEFAPGRTSLVARLPGSGGKPLCLSGHIDTVPFGESEWGFDPLSGEIDQGRLLGRGSSDMKAGVAALTRAALDLAALPPGRGGLLVIFSAGEESGCEGADFLVSSPGILEPAGALLVAEPTSNQPCLGHKGALWMKGEALGKGAHASMPDKGVNAIYKAARAITKLEKYEFPVSPHPLLGSPTLNVGTIQGGTKVNMVPDKVAFDLDARTLPGQEHDDVIALLNQELGPDVELTRHSGGAEAVWTSEDHPWVQEVFAVMSSLTGKTFQAQGLTYFTDASSLSRSMEGIPAVILGPGEAAMAHQTDEYCLVENIEQAEEAYLEIGRRWLGL